MDVVDVCIRRNGDIDDVDVVGCLLHGLLLVVAMLTECCNRLIYTADNAAI